MGMAPVYNGGGVHTLACEVCGCTVIDEQDECTRCIRLQRDKLFSVVLSLRGVLENIGRSGLLINILRDYELDPRSFK